MILYTIPKLIKNLSNKSAETCIRGDVKIYLMQYIRACPIRSSLLNNYFKKRWNIQSSLSSIFMQIANNVCITDNAVDYIISIGTEDIENKLDTEQVSRLITYGDAYYIRGSSVLLDSIKYALRGF